MLDEKSQKSSIRLVSYHQNIPPAPMFAHIKFWKVSCTSGDFSWWIECRFPGHNYIENNEKSQESLRKIGKIETMCGSRHLATVSSSQRLYYFSILCATFFPCYFSIPMLLHSKVFFLISIFLTEHSVAPLCVSASAEKGCLRQKSGLANSFMFTWLNCVWYL